MEYPFRFVRIRFPATYTKSLMINNSHFRDVQNAVVLTLNMHIVMHKVKLRGYCAVFT